MVLSTGTDWEHYLTKMVCIPCIVIPIFLYIWHRFLQPIFIKFWNPWGSGANKQPTEHETTNVSLGKTSCPFAAKDASPMADTLEDNQNSQEADKKILWDMFFGK